MAYKGESQGNRKSCKGQFKRGVSSYGMQDPDLVFNNIDMKDGDIVIDLGCGAGDYSFHAGEIVGENGIIHPCDKYSEVIERIRVRSEEEGCKNCFPMQFDLIEDDFPFDDNYADFFLFVTTMHIPAIKKSISKILSEAKRVLRPGGKFIIINCKKEQMDFGPPIEMRLSEDEAEKIALENNFQVKSQPVDLGMNYLLTLETSI